MSCRVKLMKTFAQVNKIKFLTRKRKKKFSMLMNNLYIFFNTISNGCLNIIEETFNVKR